jgi:hypothetical protein
MNRVYELPLSPDYVRHWGVPEAVRELIQNAIDSSAEFEYALLPEGLVLRSRGVTLDPSTLVLGVTSKAEDDRAIGSFGEGYKIALLVLARLNKPVAVVNGSVVWQPEFRQSMQFGTRLLHIVERPHTSDSGDLEFRIFGLDHDEMGAVVESCLLMQPPMDDAIVVPQGRILPSRPGKLYVGGLFICDTELEFGYDVRPQFITLERDRQTVSSWDLQTLTRDMWFATEQHDRVAELIQREIPDVKYVEYGGATEQVKEACYRLFQKMHPGGIAARSQKEMEEMVERGLVKTVVVGGGFYSAVSQSSSYREAEGQMVVVPTPQAVLQAFFDQYGKYMPRLPKVAMKKLIERSKEWRLK